MSKFFLRLQTALILSFFTINLTAQRAGLEVNRTSAIDRALPVLNVSVDASGRKWAANRNGVYQVKARDLSTPRPAQAGQQNVLNFRGGNTDAAWPEAVFQKMAEKPCSVTAAWYDEATSQFWIGTDEAGLFQIQNGPELKLIQKYTTANSKLKSNNITTIFQDKQNRLWIGTDKGLMYGPPGRWKADLQGYEVTRVRQFGTDVYVLADGTISKAANGEKWTDLALDTKKIEGDILDFDIDATTGKLWILSGWLTRFDLLDESYEVFAGPENYTSQNGTGIAVDNDGAVWVATADKGLFVVDKASAITVNAYVDQPISCTGNGKDATIGVKITGGDAPYQYIWSGGLSGANPAGVAPGTYQLTITDAKNRSKTAEVNVPDARLKITARQKKSVSAPGKTDGSAEVDIAGNASGLKILWDNGEAMAVATALAPGPHTVTVTDPKGCVATATVTIADKTAALTAAISEKTRINCNGDKTGTVAVQAAGGKPPYKYAWNVPSAQGEAPGSLPAGDYVVTVTDAAGATALANISLKQPEPLSATATAIAPATTIDGKATVKAKGGTGSYTYKWDSGETTADAARLGSGSHLVIVADANGCTTRATVTISENIQPLAIRLTEKSPVRCPGAKTAALAVEVAGGKGPYQYAWNNPAAKGEAPTALAAGDYVLTVTDAAGTTSTANISVKQPDALTATASVTAPASTGKADGQAAVQVAGGTGTFTYKWDNGETAAAAARLAPGTRSVTVTDANGCTATASVAVAENVQPLSVTILPKTAIRCSGEKNGALGVQVSGGKGPYKYAWDNPAAKGEAPSALAAGKYLLTVTDAAGTTATALYTFEGPDGISAWAVAQAPATTGQPDGKATAQAKGGASGFKFVWDTGETGELAQKLAAGIHTVTVTDANGCTATARVTIVEDILPLAVTVSEKTKIKCPGEKTAALAAEVTGGKGPFAYAWNNAAVKGAAPASLAAGDYTVTVTDALGKTATAALTVKQPDALTATATATAPASTGNADGKAAVTVKGGAAPYTFKWDNGETVDAGAKLAPGTRTVTVTDANGCSATATVAISENILPLAAAISEKTKINCAGEKTASLGVQVTGGKGPFKYAWNNPTAKNDAPANLAAGAYVLTVTDATGKTATAALTVKQPDALSATATATAPASTGNADGKASVTVKGGAAPYTYKWDNGETADAAAKLGPGTRSVTVTDANGCTAAATVAISENILPLAVSISEKLKIGCFGEKATLSAQVNGGKAPFKYAWNNAVAKGETPDNLPAGDYVLTITDATGKTATAAFAVKSPESISATATATAPASTGNADGQAKVAVKGGTGDYRIKWDNGETTAAATRLAPGQHTVTVTDANGCWATAGVAIPENILALTVNLAGKTKINCAGEKADIDVEVAGGKPPYTYAWNNAALSGARAANLDGGDYAVTVTDAQGKSLTQQVSIAAPAPLDAKLARNIGATSDKIGDGKAVLSVTGGTPKYSIAWDTKQSGLSASKLALGTHAATVTDANGCTATVEFETKKRALPELTGKLESGQTIRMGLLNFAVDKWDLTPAMTPMLDELYDFMVENPGAQIEIAGHTNNLPSDEFADKLSGQRAKAVADYLFEKGVDASRVMYKGYGKKLPLVPNTNEQGRRTNQRVEIKIVKLQ